MTSLSNTDAHMLCEAKKLNKNYIWLDVYADNKRAIKLYEKSEFRCYDRGIENGREVCFFKKYI